EQAEMAAAVLSAEFRAGATEPAVHDLLEVVTGADAVAQRFLQLQFGAQSEVCALVTGKPMAVTGLENEAGEDAAKRGGADLGVRVGRGVSANRDRMGGLWGARGRGERVGVVDRVPTKLVVVDRSMAMVPLTRRSAQPAALIVHASGLLESLMGLFEGVWRQAM